ncbi:MAG: ATP-binding cassette domain-containing protein [Sedimentisphaerales bacterium]|nr:ATP-binding cassette domain-containing protein [Sedimentisphaerales bacterium]
MISICNITKTFYHSGGREVPAVRGVSFETAPGEIFGLLGPNGAGKTTLLRILAGIIAPDSGSCIVDGLDSREYPEAIRSRIGFLSGNTRLYKRMTAREVLFYFGRLNNMPDELIEKRIGQVSEILDMDSFLDRRCESFSTGQMQRAGIARVIIHDPKILILDEPTLGLDIMSSQAILDFIRNARQQGRTVIFSTHYMTEAEMLCDRIGLINNGELLTIGTRQALYQQTGKDNLQEAFLSLIK